MSIESPPVTDRGPESSLAGSLATIPEATIIERIAGQAAKHPHALCISSMDRKITYSELEAKTNALSTRIRRAHTYSSNPVGIYLDSSVDLIVAELASWKAGCPYLPIDPAYPISRAAFLLTDSGASTLITRSGYPKELGAGAWTTICIDETDKTGDAEHKSTYTEASPPQSAAPDELAYVIYTSGSSGEPKGVEITHGNLLNLVDWHTRAFRLGRRDRATQIAGPGFDAAAWEVWPYLAAGASIHIPPQDARLSAKLLRDWLIAEKLTISFVPTVLAEELLHLQWPHSTTLRTMLTGGDALHVFPPAGLPFVLVNNYGPTECTVVATSATTPAITSLTLSPPRNTSSIPPLGYPIDNTQVYLLDEARNRTPDDGPGEIYIGGSGVGRGYRNRPELTASSFVTVSIDGISRRLFRTGDLARKLPDGQYAFLGRADDQIKIRGFRIEPDEIAFAINQHNSVVSSAVIARSETGEKRLVAYVILAAHAHLSYTELAGFLSRKLPDYMVPATMVLLDRIPLTANGKLDKAALPAPTDSNQLPRDTHIDPQNGVEEIVAAMLAPILGVDRVSTNDNFFSLGGHSLMGAELIAKIRDTFAVELVLRDVFECSTVRKLSGKIEALLVIRLQSMSEEEVSAALLS